MALGRACLEAERPGEALLYLRAAENSAIHRGEVRRLMGLVHLRTGDVEMAVEELMAASRAHPDDQVLAAALEEALERFIEPISIGDIADGVAAEAGARAHAEPGVFPAEPTAHVEPSIPAETLAELEADDAPGGAFGLSPVEQEQAAACGLDVDSTGHLDAGRLDGALTDRGQSLRGRGEEVAALEVAPGGAGDGEEVADLEVAPGAATRDVPPIFARETDRRGPGSAEPWSVLIRGRQERGLRSWATRACKPAIWGAAVVVAIAVALGVVCASGTPEGSQSGRSAAVEALPTSVPGDGATDPRGTKPAVYRAAPAARLSAPAPGPELTSEPAVDPAPGLPPDSGGPEGGAATDTATISVPAAPSYGFMGELGLPAPPGGVLDAANSSMDSLLPETASARPSEDLVLTFRTSAPVDRVLEAYAASGITGFRPRIVAMGGRFQGVQRTVARTTAHLAGGREARITVSNPGVDPSAKQLVPETTVRIEIF